MALILLIETATSVCSVGIAKEGKIVSLRESGIKNSHAALVTLFARETVNEAGCSFNDIDAFAVSMGPGSYTGLRIGVSTAKGFAYGTGKKLIAVNTLQSLAAGMAGEIKSKGENPSQYLYCPMIDARRMEVYTSFYDDAGNELQPVKAVVVDENTFAEKLKGNKICFAGDGAAKCKPLYGHHPNAVFIDDIALSAAHMAPIAEELYQKGVFEDIAYFEPFYLKDFIAGIPKVKGLR